jgi:hypothetical protein
MTQIPLNLLQILNQNITPTGNWSDYNGQLRYWEQILKQLNQQSYILDENLINKPEVSGY